MLPVWLACGPATSPVERFLGEVTEGLASHLTDVFHALAPLATRESLWAVPLVLALLALARLAPRPDRSRALPLPWGR